MRAAAIVVTHNSEPVIGDCVRPLLEAGLEILIVDNASRDGTVASIRSRFPSTRVILNHDNRGFAAGVNQALAQTRAEAILLVNPDCRVPAETVRSLLRLLREDPDVGIVGPRLRDAAGRIAVSAHPFETAASVIASRFGGSLIPVAVRRRITSGVRRRSYEICCAGTTPVDVDWVSGACMAVRADVLRAIGGLDESFFLYYEDEELCLRFARLGARVVYLPSVEAVHLGGASSADPAHLWPHLYRSLLRFQARHRPRTFGIVRAAVFLRAVLGVLLGAVRSVVIGNRATVRRRVQAWTTVARIALVESSAIRKAAP